MTEQLEAEAERIREWAEKGRPFGPEPVAVITGVLWEHRCPAQKLVSWEPAIVSGIQHPGQTIEWRIRNERAWFCTLCGARLPTGGES